MSEGSIERVPHRLVQLRRQKVPRQPLLGLLQQDVLVELAGNPAEDRRLPSLYPEKHLPEELFLKFRHVGENYPHESLKLFSQSVRGCGIIHVGFLSVVFDAPYYTGFTEWKPLLYLKSAYFTTSAGMRGILSAMAHGRKWCRMRISRISAGTDKPPKRSATV